MYEDTFHMYGKAIQVKKANVESREYHFSTYIEAKLKKKKHMNNGRREKSTHIDIIFVQVVETMILGAVFHSCV